MFVLSDELVLTASICARPSLSGCRVCCFGCTAARRLHLMRMKPGRSLWNWEVNEIVHRLTSIRTKPTQFSLRLFDIEQNLTRETHFHSGTTASPFSCLTAAIIRYNGLSDNFDIYKTTMPANKHEFPITLGMTPALRQCYSCNLVRCQTNFSVQLGGIYLRGRCRASCEKSSSDYWSHLWSVGS